MRLTLPPASWTAVTLEATSRRPERLWQLVHEAGNDLAAFVDE
jgi:hypothetical protein